jgi:hypothetical protein
MRNLITILFLLLFNLSFSQNPHNYKVIHNLSNWDSIHSTLKTKHISIIGATPQSAIIDLKEKYQNYLQKELQNSLDSLKKQYKSEGIPDSLKVIKSLEFSYKTDSTLIICYKHTINYEHTDIVNIMLIDSSHTPHLLSFSNKLGIDFKIKSINTSNGSFILFGELKGNPEFNCGGIVKISFIGNKRFWDYSYCEGYN